MSHNQVEEDDDINEEQIIQVILELGNQILGNLGVEELIDDVGVFFSDAFYIQFFQAAFPDIDFSQLEEATNEQEMAENIQALIDLLGQQILKYDLGHIRGEEIVSGNPEHCINLLQLVQEISLMLENKGEGGLAQQVDDESEDNEEMQRQLNQQEDDEAQIIHERQRRALQQQESSSKKQQDMSKNKSASSQKQQQRGRSYSDDRQKQPQFDVDNFDMDLQDDDDEDEEELLQMQQQLQKQQQQQRSNQKQAAKQTQEEDDDDEEDEEFDEEDLKMYEQFLANQQQQQQQLAMGNHQQVPPPADHDLDDDEEEDDLEDLDPEFIAAAQEMGLNAQQIRQLQQQLQSQGYGDEDGEDGDDGQESYYTEGEIQTRIKLLKNKSYSAPYILIGDCFDEPLYDTESQVLQKACSTTMLQSLELKEQSGDEDGQGEDDMDEETAAQLLYQQQQQQKHMLMQQQQQQQQQQQKQHQQQQQHSKITEASKSKESSQYGNKNKPVQHLSDQKGYQKQFINDDSDDEEMEIDMADKLRQLQQQQQQHQFQSQDEDEYQEDDDEEEYAMQMQQQQLSNQKQKQQQQIMAMQMQQDEEDDDDQEQEGEGEEEDDDKMLIELDDLDENERAMLLQYLQQEYEKNPDQFPFPKELLQEYMMQQQRQQEEGESVRDIKSEEMIVEDAQQLDSEQIEGGEQEIEEQEDYGEEDGEELTEEQQQQLQQLLLMQQQQQFQQQQEGDYGEEDDEAQQMHPQFVQMKPKKIKKKGKSRPKSGGSKRPAQPQNYRQQHYDAENMDPNMLQQMIMAQSHQDMPPRPQQKRRLSAGKKKVQSKSNLKLQPYSMPKTMRVLHPSTPGAHFKSFNTNRSSNQTFSKKKTKKKSTKRTIQQNEQVQYPPGMPVLNEDYLNQLSEEELLALLEHQQQLMMMQQQQDGQQMTQQQQEYLMMQQQQQQMINQNRRPKSAKRSLKPSGKQVTKSRSQIYGHTQPSTYGAYKKKPNTKLTKKKKKKPLQNHNGVFMNNFFPALEGGQVVDASQTTEEGYSSKDQRYPKYSNENINNPNYLQQDQIDEVSPEQEEGESQENIQRMNNYYSQQDQDQVVQDQDEMYQDQQNELLDGEGMDLTEVDDNEEVELTEEQLVQLLQNAHNLSPEQQAQLQIILREKMKEGVQNERAQSYQNIYHILMDNVQKAKDRLAHLGDGTARNDAEEDTDRRILKQKMEFDALLKQYLLETRAREQKKHIEDAKLEKQLQRDSKMQSIKDKKFEEDLINQQKGLMYKRNAQQVRLCQKVYKLASELEKNKLLAEKREFRENLEKKKAQKRMMIDAIETYYKDRITMLKERIENERFERKIAQQAQSQALSRMKRELNNAKKKEVDKYLHLLKQEDQRYDFESTNLGKLEQEIVKLYKR